MQLNSDSRKRTDQLRARPQVLVFCMGLYTTCSSSLKTRSIGTCTSINRQGYFHQDGKSAFGSGIFIFEFSAHIRAMELAPSFKKKSARGVHHRACPERAGSRHEPGGPVRVKPDTRNTADQNPPVTLRSLSTIQVLRSLHDSRTGDFPRRRGRVCTFVEVGSMGSRVGRRCRLAF